MRRARAMTAVALLALLALAPAGLADRPIVVGDPPAPETGAAPGDPVLTILGVPHCTLGFALRSPNGTAYFVTAGHCVRKGDVVTSARGQVGRVVYARDDATALVDLALVRIDSGVAWSPTVRVIGGPTGAAAVAEVGFGDLAALHGHAFTGQPETRVRSGVVTHYNATTLAWSTVSAQGDSGGPVVHLRTGKALGIVADLGPLKNERSTDVGLSIHGILSTLRAAGWDVALVPG